MQKIPNLQRLIERIVSSNEGLASFSTSLPTAGEVRAHDDELRQLRNAGDILATGIMRVAQIIGLLPGAEHLDETRLHGSRLDLTELLRWEHEGIPLVKRMETAWQPRLLAQGGTVLDALQRKAEQNTLRLVQSALRDLDVRVSHMRTSGGLEALGPPPWLGSSHIDKKSTVQDTDKKHRAAETQDWKPQLIPRPPSAPPSRSEDSTHARRIAGLSAGAEDCPNIPPPSWT